MSQFSTERSDDTVEYLEELKCHEMFDKAVEVLPTIKMWTLYVDFCVERLQRGGGTKISNKVTIQWDWFGKYLFQKIQNIVI